MTYMVELSVFYTYQQFYQKNVDVDLIFAYMWVYTKVYSQMLARNLSQR